MTAARPDCATKNKRDGKNSAFLRSFKRCLWWLSVFNREQKPIKSTGNSMFFGQKNCCSIIVQIAQTIVFHRFKFVH
jgi:hypothetical protein